MITYANCNVRFKLMLFCHMYFNTLILRKTTSSVTKDPCHLERNFTAVRGKRGSWRKPCIYWVFMGHSRDILGVYLSNSPPLSPCNFYGKRKMLCWVVWGLQLFIILQPPELGLFPVSLFGAVKSSGNILFKYLSYLQHLFTHGLFIA